MEYGLTEEQFKNLKNIFKKHKEVETVYLYGERLDDDIDKNCPLKITFLGPDLNTKIFKQIQEDLESIKLPFKCEASLFLEIKDVETRMEIGQCAIEFYSK